MSESMTLDQPWQIVRYSLLVLEKRLDMAVKFGMKATLEMRAARESWGIKAKQYKKALQQIQDLSAEIDADLALGRIHPALQAEIDRRYGPRD
jgi:hypothetical protein